jgi:capsular exopolysaccharide synthesis family protein
MSNAPERTSLFASGDTLDLVRYWKLLVRRRWIVLAALAAVILATVAVTLRATKIYSAVCTIIIESSAPRVLDAQQVQDVVETGAGATWNTRDYFETQIKILTSRAVATRVVERLALASNPAFLGIDRVRDPAEQERLRRTRDPVALVQAKLRVDPVKFSRVVRLVVEDRDADLAAAIANAYADAYISESLAVRSSTTRNASDWLQEQLADLEGKLEQTGKALFEFKRRNDIVSTSWEDRQTMVSERLQTFNQALAKAGVQRAQLQARAEEIARALAAVERDGEAELESLPAVAGNSAILSLKQKYNESLVECADLEAKYLEGHPTLQACNEKLATMRRSLEGEIRTTLEAARREFDEVSQTERNLRALYEQTKTEAFGFNQYEREYVELKRAYENNQRLYDTVLKRLKDAGLAGMLEMSNVRLLDRARPSLVHVRPDLRKNLLAALVVGLVLGVGLAFAVEALDSSVRTQEHLEQLGATFLGVIPRVQPAPGEKADDLAVHRAPKSAVAECCRAIRTNLLFMSPDKPLKTILVTSSSPQDGKTTAAVDLSIAMADSGNRVLLLDADMRRPRVHKALGLRDGGGLSSLILGEVRLEDALQATPVQNLFAIPCGSIPPNPSELLHTEAFAAVLRAATERFDRIVIDSPPVAAVSDALIISTQVDGTVVIVKAGTTTRDAVRRTLRSLADLNARVLGVVLNDVDTKDSRYGAYYYSYGYYYGEKRGEAA